MKGYKMNFATKTLTITKAFAAKAMLPNSEECNLINNLSSMIPDLKITYRTHSGSKTHPYKGLTFTRMERYILCHQNADELMIAFIAIMEVAKSQNNPHNLVCKWFLTQFPEYREIPTLIDGKIAAVKPINTIDGMEFLDRNIVENIAA